MERYDYVSDSAIADIKRNDFATNKTKRKRKKIKRITIWIISMNLWSRKLILVKFLQEENCVLFKNMKLKIQLVTIEDGVGLYIAFVKYVVDISISHGKKDLLSVRKTNF